MRDWPAVVRENLRGLRLDPVRQQDVIAELAAHLEDIYRQFLAEGLCEAEAFRCSVETVTDWPSLARQIQRAKREEDVMNTRTKQLWFPGFVSLASAMIVWAILETTALRGNGGLLTSITNQLSSDPTDQLALAIYLPWVILLPCCGAAGAYLSQRGGGSRLARMASGLLPSIVLVGLFILILPLEFLYCHTPFVIHHPFYVLGRALSWVTIPTVALLLGAVPFLRTSELRAL
jgi:hypothetical protein